MAGYYSDTVEGFLATRDEAIVAQLALRQSEHFGEVTDRQLYAWRTQIALLRDSLGAAVDAHRLAAHWGLVIEYPLLRLQKRLDVVIIAGATIAVIEFKVDGSAFSSADLRQVEDYGLDLNDFHSASSGLRIWPVLCATAADTTNLTHISAGVSAVAVCNGKGLREVCLALVEAQRERGDHQLDYRVWQAGVYRPVPTIVQAAELLFAEHDVQDIARSASEPANLADTTETLIAIIERARARREHIVAFVTGVPGSGKTLAGLNACHDKRFSQAGEQPGAYLSGNSPLVRVLREALTEDHARRLGCASRMLGA